MVVATLWLPVYYFRGAAYSFAHGIPHAFRFEPFGVAILGACAGIVMAMGTVSGRRWLAAGMLLAFGAQTFFFAWGNQFGAVFPAKPGSAGLVGMAGGLLLVAAGVLGAVGITKDRAVPEQAGSAGMSDSPNPF